MKFDARLENFNTRLWSYHIKVPLAIARQFIDAGHKRVVATLNGVKKIQCAIMPAGDDIFFININKKVRDELHLKEGSSVHVHLIKDESQYGMPFPEELKELLHQDPVGNKLFHDLTPGKQRNIIYAVSQVKNPELRIQRALVMMDHLKKNQGKINFKQLYEELRK